MLYHLNCSLRVSLGGLELGPPRCATALHRSLLKRLVLHVIPWPKGKAQAPEHVLAQGPVDFESERAEFERVYQRFTDKALEGAWPAHSSFGPLTGREWRRLQYRHLDHDFP